MSIYEDMARDAGATGDEIQQMAQAIEADHREQEKVMSERMPPGGDITDWITSLQPFEPTLGSAGYYEEGGQFLTLTAVINKIAEKAAALEAKLKGRPSAKQFAIVLEDREKAEAKLSKMEEALRDFDIRGAESWARATAEQWNHSDAETRQIMHGGMKVAEKLLAILPGLEEALAGGEEDENGN